MQPTVANQDGASTKPTPSGNMVGNGELWSATDWFQQPWEDGARTDNFGVKFLMGSGKREM